MVRKKIQYKHSVCFEGDIFSSPAHALLSYIITVAKYYIFERKFYLKNLSIKGFENFLKQKF